MLRLQGVRSFDLKPDRCVILRHNDSYHHLTKDRDPRSHYPLTSKFVGTGDYALATFHDLMDDDVESDSSSIGNIVAPSHPLSHE